MLPGGAAITLLWRFIAKNVWVGDEPKGGKEISDVKLGKGVGYQYPYDDVAIIVQVNIIGGLLRFLDMSSLSAYFYFFFFLYRRKQLNILFFVMSEPLWAATGPRINF